MSIHLSIDAQAQLDALLAAYPGNVPQANHPGTVVGIVNKQGDHIYLKAAGPNTANEPTPLRTDDVFAIFSCSKVVTAIAIMHLVENGGLDLDDPVSKYIPAFSDMDIITDSTETSIQTRKAKTPVTTRMLLTHTAGFSYSWYNLHLRRWYEQNRHLNGIHEGVPLVNEPGTKFDYGISMDWAGEVLVAATGQSLGSYFDQHLFQPLGLKDITFNPWARPEIKERLATLHAWDKTNHTFTPRDYPSEHPELPMERGGSGLFSTAADYLELLKVLLNEGKGTNGAQILKPETVKQMFADQCEDLADLGALGTNAVVPSTDDRTAAEPLILLPGTRKGWGLSFLLNLEDIPGGRKAGSAEWGGIGNLFWLADPTSEVAMIIFNSALPYGMPGFFKLYGDLQSVVYSEGALVRQA